MGRESGRPARLPVCRPARPAVLGLFGFGWLALGGALMAFAPTLAAQNPSGRAAGSKLQVVAVDIPELKRLHLHVLVRAGSTAEEPSHPGTAYVTARALTLGGTRSLTASESAMAREKLDLDVRTWVDRQYFHASASLAPRSLYSGLRLLTDIVFNAALEDEAFAAAVRSEPPATDAETGASALEECFFSNPFWARPPRPWPDLARAISGEDLRRFHREHFLPGAAVIAYAGPLSSGRVFQEVRASLAGFAEPTVIEGPVAPWGDRTVSTVTLHEVAGGVSRVVLAVRGPDGRSAGWETWVKRAFSADAPLRKALDEQGVPGPNRPWLRTSPIGPGQFLFRASLDVKTGQESVAESVLRKAGNAMLEISRPDDRKPAESGRPALGVEDILMRYCIDRAEGFPIAHSEAWVEAAGAADSRAWETVLRPLE